MDLICKCCGEKLSLKGNEKVITCPFCLSKISIPDLNQEEEILKLYNKANKLLKENLFMESYEAYKEILKIDSEASEAYFGMFLAKFGILYVKDPLTKKMLPTCHRLTSKDILIDSNYLNALKYADSIRKEYYLEEGKKIQKILKEIYKLSENEEPYDIFISYKDTYNNERTEDSFIAEKLYNLLTSKGYKVFYARVSLEKRLGEVYEPIIYSALITSKVMISIATKEEYINAPWVKNEWNRYLSLLSEDKSKTLIPLYKDLNPNSLPSELRFFQALDLNKDLDFKLLLQKIDKLFKVEALDDDLLNQKTKDLIKQIEVFLNERKYEEALNLSDTIIKLEPNLAHGYLLKFFAYNHFRTFNEIKNNEIFLRSDKLFKTALNLSKNDIKKALERLLKSNDLVYFKRFKEAFKNKTSLTIAEDKDLLEVLEYLKETIYKDKALRIYKYELSYNKAKEAFINNDKLTALKLFQELMKVNYQDSREIFLDELTKADLNLLKNASSNNFLEAYENLNLLMYFKKEEASIKALEVNNYLKEYLKEMNKTKDFLDILTYLKTLPENPFIKKCIKYYNDLYHYQNAFKVTDLKERILELKKVSSDFKDLKEVLNREGLNYVSFLKSKLESNNLEEMNDALRLINEDTLDYLLNINDLKKDFKKYYDEEFKKQSLKAYEDLFKVEVLDRGLYETNYNPKLHDEILVNLKMVLDKLSYEELLRKDQFRVNDLKVKVINLTNDCIKNKDKYSKKEQRKLEEDLTRCLNKAWRFGVLDRPRVDFFKEERLKKIEALKGFKKYLIPLIKILILVLNVGLSFLLEHLIDLVLPKFFSVLISIVFFILINSFTFHLIKIYLQDKINLKLLNLKQK